LRALTIGTKAGHRSSSLDAYRGGLAFLTGFDHTRSACPFRGKTGREFYRPDRKRLEQGVHYWESRKPNLEPTKATVPADRLLKGEEPWRGEPPLFPSVVVVHGGDGLHAGSVARRWHEGVAELGHGPEDVVVGGIVSAVLLRKVQAHGKLRRPAVRIRFRALRSMLAGRHSQSRPSTCSAKLALMAEPGHQTGKGTPCPGGAQWCVASNRESSCTANRTVSFQNFECDRASTMRPWAAPSAAANTAS